jgi:IclR family acetate operon transcriptional repressor
MNESPYTVRAAIRVLDILDLLHRASNGVTLGEVADATGMPKSSAFRYLATLEARGYAQKEPTGAYRLGMALVSYHSGQLEVLSARARPVLEELRDRYDETVNIGVLDGGRVVYLEIVESRRGMRFAARPGDREPIHCTALGKAIASTLDDDRLRAILSAEGMPQRTPRTITDSDLFVKEIEEVRRTGFALDDRENEEDGRCVAVPVLGIRVPAAISLSAPAARFSEEDATRAASSLRRATKRIAREIGGER